MPPPSISFSPFPIFNFPEHSSVPPHSSDRVLLAQLTPRPGASSAVASDAGSSVAVSSGMRGRTVPVVPIYTLAELAAARRERERAFSDPQLLGVYFSTWDSDRNTTYQNISLGILRMRYFLEGRQTDTFSIRVPLLSWARSMRSSGDGIFRETFERVRESLRSLREPYNRERADRLIRLMDEVQRTVGGTEGEAISPPAAPVPPPVAPPPGSPPVSEPVPPPSSGSGSVAPPREPERSVPPPVVTRVTPVSFTSVSREVSDGDGMMRDLRDHAVRSARYAAERYGRRSGREIDTTLRLHIQYNTERSGLVMARDYRDEDRELVQQIIEAVSRDLPHFRGHGGDAVALPLHFSLH